ncbi:MAG: ATP-dependent helicase [Acutalibacteraceae bacterium]
MQLEAVLTTEGPLLVLAGAGSGKTTVLVNRIVNLVKYGNAYYSDRFSRLLRDGDEELLKAYLDGSTELFEAEDLLSVNAAKPWQILAITFTNKAAGELKERICKALGEEGNDVWASTFHSTCAKILRRHADEIGYTHNFTIYDTDDSKRAIKECIRKLGYDEKMIPVKSVMSQISKAKDVLVTPEEFIRTSVADIRLRKIGEVYAEYQKFLKAADAMDFDDLIVNTVKLLKTSSETREYYQNRFKYIMVDEYQDTNHAQYILTSLLAEGHKNICVVGDDDQSIYRFRGATIENILSFEKQYSNAKVIRLEQNYRSTQTILDAANAVISNNEQRKGKNLWTANGRGDKIEFYTADDELGESRYVADTVVSNVANGENWNDHAILYRMNAQSNLIEQAFIRSGVPYRIIGGHRFYDRKEIRDAMAYLHVINNTADEIRLRRIINEPKRGIGETSMNAVFDIAAGLGISPFEVIKTADQYAKLSRASAKLMSFAKMIEGFREKMEIMPLGDLLGVVLDESGYMLSLANEPESYQDRAANLSELANNIRRYNEENPDGDLNGFLQETALLTDIDNYNAQAETVIMMTIHSAKGLEFQNVFIVGMEEGIFPGMQTILYEPENIEEERRLAYVAITRAKRRLYISCARTRMLYGNTSRNAPSRFVREIPDELLERRGTSMFSYQQSAPSSNHTERPFGGSSRGGASRVSGTIEQKASRGFSAASGFSGVSSKPAAKAKETYSIGETVEHKAYGKGVIISQQVMANDTMLEIAFEKVGTKKIMANYAKLKKL